MHVVSHLALWAFSNKNLDNRRSRNDRSSKFYPCTRLQLPTRKLNPDGKELMDEPSAAALTLDTTWKGTQSYLLGVSICDQTSSDEANHACIGYL